MHVGVYKMFQNSTLHPRGGFSSGWCATAAAMAALATVTIVGNAAVLIALRRVRTAPAHYPLASLATADLLVGLFVLPVAATRELFVFQLDPITCDCWKMLDVLCCTASILSLCALGWERWSGITAPLGRARRAKKARLYTALVWPTAVVVALPTAFIPSPKYVNAEEKACPDNTNVGYVFYSATLSFYLPAVVMLVLYARILLALSVPPKIRAHRGGMPCIDSVQEGKASKTALTRCATAEPIRTSQRQQNNSIVLSPKGRHLNQPESTPVDGCTASTPLKHPGAPCTIISRQRRATRTIVRLMGLFLLCWSPFFTILPIDSLCDCVQDSIWQWCTWLGFTNSALNPLVYAAASPSVRRALHASLASTVRADVPMTPTLRHR
ncbi:octopamine receptor-like isoform X2 [Trichoplusia ni]|uniref:Octopamine receptor-like isoform X2 n=1 Tax=Trichoplusia ni TaxID=7111 RepID=A0A7E5VKG7_TRINI|nr:octopamine receptor-like isoform X2 [Trichoplusia ni]